uniref:Uncharacterized protein n=1 Tax=Arundo donax TaxID=35708 RepID=A0A0A9FIZ6_ARUDO
MLHWLTGAGSKHCHLHAVNSTENTGIRKHLRWLTVFACKFQTCTHDHRNV